MKIYAVVIGKKQRNTQYVSAAPCGATDSERCLAVYETMKEAKAAKLKILKGCGHKRVYVVAFVPARS